MTTILKKDQTILLLGGNGFVGSNLAHFFVSKNQKVIVFGKEESDYKCLDTISNKIKIIKGNFDDEGVIENVFKTNKIDIIIYLISSVIPATPFNEIIKNTEITSIIKLLDIMHKNQVNNIVFFSSGGAVYGVNGKKINKEESPLLPINFHGWLKMVIETYIQMYQRTHGINYLIIRASNIYGKNQNTQGNLGLIAVTLGKVLRGEKVEVWGDGKIVRDYIFIDDICNAVFLLIKNNEWNNIFNIGSGKGTSINTVIKIIKKVTKINFRVDYLEGRKIDVPFNILNISKLKSAIKFTETSLTDGIQKTLTWLKNNNNA